MSFSNTLFLPRPEAEAPIFPLLSEETISFVFSELKPEDLLRRAGQLNWMGLRIAKDKNLWRKKLQMHFPHHYQKIWDDVVLDKLDIESIDWLDKFKIAYQYDYGHLKSVREKQLFSCAKEKKLNGLLELNIVYEDLYLKDKNGRTLLWWLHHHSYQPLLDHLYKKFKEIQYEYKQPSLPVLQSGRRGVPAPAPEPVREEPREKLPPLTYAIMFNRPLDEIETLIAAHPERSYKNVLVAAEYGLFPIVQSLITHGFAVEPAPRPSASALAIRRKDTPLHAAAERGDVDMVRLLVASGADLNAESISNRLRLPLHVAAWAGRMPVVNYFLDEKQQPVERANILRSTALHSAAAGGQRKMVSHLIERGADINKQDRYGKTPLHAAGYDKNCAAVNDLLRRGADHLLSTIGTLSNQRPIHVAADDGDVATLAALITHDASKAHLNGKDSHGYTPLDLAAQRRYVAAVNLLLQHKVEISNIALELFKGFMDKKEIASYQLQQYLEERPKQDQYLRKISLKFFSLFCCAPITLNFGISRERKVLAATVLSKVHNGSASRACLLDFKAELSQGRLGEIAKNMGYEMKRIQRELSPDKTKNVLSRLRV